MDIIFENIEYYLIIIVFISSILSVLQVASLLSFYGLLIMFMEPRSIVPIATIFFLSMNIFKVRMFYNSIDLKLVKKLVLSSLPGLLTGALLISVIPTDIARKVLALFVLLFIVNDIFGILKFEIKTNTLSIIALGGTYGFMSGFLGAGSMVRTPFLMKMGLKKETFIGTAAAASLFSNIIKLTTYGTSGLINDYVLVNGVLAALVGFVGANIGKIFLGKINDKSFKIILQVGLLVGAINGLIK